jgi:RimJ/RimL family protein N-acetyltransferase
MDVEVRLREVRDEDLEVLYEYQLEPESNAMAGVEPRDWEGFRAHRARIAVNPDAIVLAIVVDGDGVVGDVMSWRNSQGVREVGYRIGKAFWGRGIATAALAAFLAEQAERPLYAHVVMHNLGSIKVLERCGFERLPEGAGPDPDPEAHEYVLR